MWLLEKTALQNLKNAFAFGYKPTDEQLTQFADIGAKSSRISKTQDDTAVINVSGILTNKPDIIAMLFGGGNTTYGEIESALKAADDNGDVKKAILNVDSPGGTIAGLFDAMEAVANFSKPLTAHVSNVAASAAYGLSSQADKIIAQNKSTKVGSIGVAVDIPVDDDVISITSSNAPKKRPDVKTEEGVKVVQEELDAIHDIFVEAIATGRDIDKKTVNESFGQGGSFIAAEALKRGMIDAVASPSKVTKVKKSAALSSIKPKVKAMDVETLKAEHPAVYAAVFELGAEKERDRVEGHLIMGEESGDMKTALTAVKEGSLMTTALQAKYLAAGMNRADINARQQEDVGDTNTPEANEDEDEDARIAKEIMAKAFEFSGIEQSGLEV